MRHGGALRRRTYGADRSAGGGWIGGWDSSSSLEVQAKARRGLHGLPTRHLMEILDLMDA